MSDLQQSYDIAAPRADVFRALTEPDVLDTWWTTRSESDPRPGGAFVYTWEFEDASRNHVQSGEYREVEDGRLISYPWAAGGETIVTFRLEDAPGGTRLTLDHTGFPDEGARDHHEQGWAGFLNNLESVASGGPDRRAEMMGLNVRAPR
jgi:glutathione S-transferase